MIEPAYIFIPLISLFAFYLKGITGTGTSTVVIAFSSLLIEPKAAVVLAAFINIFGGFSMLRIDPVPMARKYWMPIACSMIVGSILGASLLKVFPNDGFQLLLGSVFLLTALWFFYNAGRTAQTAGPPDTVSAKDVVVGSFAGFCGGFIGINAPPLILHFGSYLNKQFLRRLLVVIFIPAALAQTATFAVNGLLGGKTLIYGLLMIPGMFLGIYLGNRAFHSVSEAQFKKLLAIFLLIVSVRLIWKSLY